MTDTTITISKSGYGAWAFKLMRPLWDCESGNIVVSASAPLHVVSLYACTCEGYNVTEVVIGNVGCNNL